ncbi:MAG TPA: RsmE family RNA methyltransferase [Rectinemataceae bacterium]|nr:RsmE family RNA methyltransferase [Rectinemataceae bacterium]
MNLLILDRGEVGSLIPADDRRTLHVARVLKKARGEEIAAGILTDGPFSKAPGSLGRARIEKLDGEGMILEFQAETEAPALRPLRLILGFPRPIQGGRLLKDLASLGVAEIVLCGTELGEKSYLESDLWKKGEYRKAVLEGAEQAGNPRLPRVRREWSLKAALASLRAGPVEAGEPDWEAGGSICLHPGENALLLGEVSVLAPLSLAIGSERGWTEAELARLSAAGFQAARLGDRILKTETAALAAVSISLSRLGFM